MLIVVLYHCMLFWKGTWFISKPIVPSKGLATISAWMNTFHIYGFTLVSGYIFHILKIEKKRYDKFIPFVLNKTKRLLIPYIFVAIIWVVPVTRMFFDYDTMTIINKYVLAISPSQLWFLIMLFNVFIIFWILSKFFENHNFWGTVTALAFYGVGLVGTFVVPNVFCIWTACRYVIFFFIGYKIRQYGSVFLMKIPGIVWILAHLLLFALEKYISGIDNTLLKLINPGLTFALNAVGALGAFVVLQKIASRFKWQESKMFSIFSKNSMTIYLFHQQVIYFALKLFNGMNPYIHTIINFAVAIGVSLLISAVLRHFKMTRLLIGEK